MTTARKKNQVIHCLARRFDVLFLKKLYILSCLEKWVPIRYIRSILACPKAAKMLMRNSFICTKLPTRAREVASYFKTF